MPRTVLFLVVLSVSSFAQSKPEDSESKEPTPSTYPIDPPANYLETVNPAFPPIRVRAVPVHRGRAFSEEDLAPYFSKGELQKAKEAFDKGAYQKARELLAKQADSQPVRYLRALSALRAKDSAAAGKEFSELAESYPPLRDRCLAHAGAAYEDAGQWKLAAELLRKVDESSRSFVDARLGLARVLRRLGDLKGATKALAPLASREAPSWGRDVGAEALLTVAGLAAERKDPKGEQEALLTLWARHPRADAASEAEKRLGGLAKIPIEAKVTRAEVLVELHRNRPGLDVLEPLLPKLALPDPLACRARFIAGKALRKERLHTKAIELLAPVADKCKDPELRARALYVLGSSRSIVDFPKATKTYETLAQDYPDHSFADDALYYAADVFLRANDPANALSRIDELVRRYPRGDFTAEALFKAYWIHRAAGRTQEAEARLDQIEELFVAAEESYEVERARYWRARQLEEGGDKSSAATIFERLALDHPATYYGLMARARLATIDPQRAQAVDGALKAPQPPSSPWPLFAGPLEKEPHFLAAVELLRMGLFEAVSSELLAIDRAGLPADSVRLMVQLLSMANDPRAAHAVARTSLRRDLSGPITAQNRPVWEVAYPNAFRELITKHSQAANGLDPDLLQALMREESALDPKALSWAGALGLTQLMPSTARAVAAQLKIKRVTTEMLLDPDVNIRLGAAYLSRLVQRYGGTHQLALASYNAGENAVDRWRRERPKDEIDVWVENIPIAETRGYVKRVLRSYNTYRLLYAQQAGGEASNSP